MNVLHVKSRVTNMLIEAKYKIFDKIFLKKDDDYKELEILHSQQDEDLESLKTENSDLVRLQNAKTNQKKEKKFLNGKLDETFDEIVKLKTEKWAWLI